LLNHNRVLTKVTARKTSDQFTIVMNTGKKFYTTNKNSTKRLESDGVKPITY